MANPTQRLCVFSKKLDWSSPSNLAFRRRTWYGRLGETARPPGAMMKRLLLVACVASATGCLTPQDRADWAAAVKDWHGDNMRMRTGPPSADDPSAPARQRDGSDSRSRAGDS
jgi:hypothetical protein